MAISAQDLEALQLADWLDLLDDVLYSSGRDRVRQLFANLQIHAQKAGVVLPVTSQTPYVNTIDVELQPALPRQPRDREAHPALGPLERDGHGRPRE